MSVQSRLTPISYTKSSGQRKTYTEVGDELWNTLIASGLIAVSRDSLSDLCNDPTARFSSSFTRVTVSVEEQRNDRVIGVYLLFRSATVKPIFEIATPSSWEDAWNIAKCLIELLPLG